MNKNDQCLQDLAKPPNEEQNKHISYYLYSLKSFNDGNTFNTLDILDTRHCYANEIRNWLIKHFNDKYFHHNDSCDPTRIRSIHETIETINVFTLLCECSPQLHYLHDIGYYNHVYLAFHQLPIQLKNILIAIFDLIIRVLRDDKRNYCSASSLGLFFFGWYDPSKRITSNHTTESDIVTTLFIHMLEIYATGTLFNHPVVVDVMASLVLKPFGGDNAEDKFTFTDLKDIMNYYHNKGKLPEKIKIGDKEIATKGLNELKMFYIELFNFDEIPIDFQIIHKDIKNDKAVIKWYEYINAYQKILLKLLFDHYLKVLEGNKSFKREAAIFEILSMIDHGVGDNHASEKKKYKKNFEVVEKLLSLHETKLINETDLMDKHAIYANTKLKETDIENTIKECRRSHLWEKVRALSPEMSTIPTCRLIVEPYEDIHVADELRLCQRFVLRSFYSIGSSKDKNVKKWLDHQKNKLTCEEITKYLIQENDTTSITAEFVLRNLISQRPECFFTYKKDGKIQNDFQKLLSIRENLEENVSTAFLMLPISNRNNILFCFDYIINVVKKRFAAQNSLTDIKLIQAHLYNLFASCFMDKDANKFKALLHSMFDLYKGNSLVVPKSFQETLRYLFWNKNTFASDYNRIVEYIDEFIKNTSGFNTGLVPKQVTLLMMSLDEKNNLDAYELAKYYYQLPKYNRVVLKFLFDHLNNLNEEIKIKSMKTSNEQAWNDFLLKVKDIIFQSAKEDSKRVMAVFNRLLEMNQKKIINQYDLRTNYLLKLFE